MKRYEPDGTPFPVTSPEGVPLQFEIANAGARAGAVILDYGFIFLGIGLCALMLAMSGLLFVSALARALFMLIVFLAIHFYFSFFELRWQGATPGKRIAGVRVINRFGGPVRGDAVVTRNFLRIVEIFVPLELLAMWSNGSLGELPWYLVLLALAWAFLLMFLPLLNRQRMRLGDLAAGTVVVRAPKPRLLADVSEAGARARTKTNRFGFTRDQLDIYGEYELQVLEEVLRREGPGQEETLDAVTERIVRKIRWPRAVPRRQQRAFLQGFYDALRAHRERRMLFGKRKEDKHADEG